MKKYYCPYCNPKYQFSKNINKKLVCGLCGEDLLIKPLIQTKQFIAISLIIVFSLPFILITFSSIDINKEEKEFFQSKKL